MGKSHITKNSSDREPLRKLPPFSGHTNLTKTGGNYAQNAPSKEDSKVQRRV